MPARREGVDHVPDGVWPYLRRAKELFGLTNQDLADLTGLSTSRVKQCLNGYRSYEIRPGSWTVGKPK